MKQKTLREDAHSREAEICRKRPRSARECAKAHSLFWSKTLDRLRGITRIIEYLEYRYECLKLPYTAKRVADDYIACVKTRDERMADLAYAAGLRDGLALVKKLGMLVESAEDFLPVK